MKEYIAVAIWCVKAKSKKQVMGEVYTKQPDEILITEKSK